jgi:hypothetical protein
VRSSLAHLPDDESDTQKKKQHSDWKKHACENRALIDCFQAPPYEACAQSEKEQNLTDAHPGHDKPNASLCHPDALTPLTISEGKANMALSGESS